MADLILEASTDLVARIAHEGDPVRAVVELVWNVVLPVRDLRKRF